VSIIVDTKERPYQGVAIEGVAEVLDDPDRAVAELIARRYLGDRRRACPPAALAVERVAIRIRHGECPGTSGQTPSTVRAILFDLGDTLFGLDPLPADLASWVAECLVANASVEAGAAGELRGADRVASRRGDGVVRGGAAFGTGHGRPVAETLLWRRGAGG
jgi:hypothetical protein